MIHTKLRKQIPIRMEKLKGKQLLAWERNFYNSFKNSTTLTDRQLSTLTKIEERLDKEHREREQWLSEWDYQKELYFQLACRYYHSTGPYSFYKKHKDVITKAIKLQNDFVPTRKQYKAIVENKYVEKAIRAYFDPPKYDVGDLVYVTGEYAYRLLEENRWIGLIIRPATKEFRKNEKKYVVKPINKVRMTMFNQYEDAIIPEKYLLTYRSVS